jgi:hypothetical protein
MNWLVLYIFLTVIIYYDAPLILLFRSSEPVLFSLSAQFTPNRDPLLSESERPRRYLRIDLTLGLVVYFLRFLFRHGVLSK